MEGAEWGDGLVWQLGSVWELVGTIFFIHGRFKKKSAMKTDHKEEEEESWWDKYEKWVGVWIIVIGVIAFLIIGLCVAPYHRFEHSEKRANQGDTNLVIQVRENLELKRQLQREKEQKEDAQRDLMKALASHGAEAKISFNYPNISKYKQGDREGVHFWSRFTVTNGVAMGRTHFEISVQNGKLISVSGDDEIEDTTYSDDRKVATFELWPIQSRRGGLDVVASEPTKLTVKSSCLEKPMDFELK